MDVCGRPIFYKDELTNKMSYENIQEQLKGDFFWNNLILGFNAHKDSIRYKKNDYRIYELNELFDGVNSETNPAKLERFIKKKRYY